MERAIRSQKRVLRFLAISVASVALIAAQQRCDVGPRVYALNADSTVVEGCFEPLRCPLRLATDIGGTFTLFETPSADAVDTTVYQVDDVNWLVRWGEEDFPITGRGTYRTVGEPASRHQMSLDLAIGDAPIERFDSGLVPIDKGVEGRIDIELSIHGKTGYDTVIDLHSIAMPIFDPAPKIECGPEGLLCDAETEVCVRKTPIGPATVFSCEPIPAECGDKVDCACAGKTLCVDAFDLCSEIDESTIECQCPRCQ